jgi:hypothetical protein
MPQSETVRHYRVVQEKYQQYKFSLESRKQFKLLSKLDNWHGILALLEDYAIILISILITCYLSDWFYPLALLLIG